MWSVIVTGEHDFVREGFPTEVTFWANTQKMKRQFQTKKKKNWANGKRVPVVCETESLTKLDI